MSSRKAVVVREVWAYNVEDEFALIRKILFLYPFASMDTEFPGVICRPNIEKRLCSQLHPLDNYHFMKINVDALNLIQVGLALSDAKGNLPDLGTDSCYVWEFNFSDFDVDCDLYNPDSIELLKRQGINFQKNKEEGIDSWDFARLLLKSGLVFNNSAQTWVTFHSTYDFGFLIKVLTRRELPADVGTFMNMVAFYFGVRVYDMKHMIRFCEGLYGGLERVAKTLQVDRVAGNSHQAGSDSLLTLQTFMKLKDSFFRGRTETNLDGVRNVWYSNPILGDWLKQHADTSHLDKLKLIYYLINKSPWSCLDENESFFTTADSVIKLLPEATKPITGWKGLEYKAAFPMLKPPGANFYPPDMDKMV